MTVTERKIDYMFFTVNGRTVSLQKDLVEKYTEVVCPVNESFLSSMIKVFGKDCGDEVMSYKIALDMTKELKEYGYTLENM